MKKDRWNDDLKNWVEEYFYPKDVVDSMIGEITETGTLVDDELSTDSRYPVQNKVITNALNDKALENHVHNYSDILDRPSVPSLVDTVMQGNPNAVTSNAVYDYMLQHHHGVLLLDFTSITIYQNNGDIDTVNFLTDNTSSFTDLNYEDIEITYADETTETVRFYVE